MADPRIPSDNFGAGLEGRTFQYDATIVYDATKAGGGDGAGWAAVTMVGNNTVGLAADGDMVVGQLKKIEQDVCAVDIEGVMRFKGGTGAALTAKRKIVGALLVAAKGYIREAAVPGGAYAQAAATDNYNGRGCIRDGSVSTSVLVEL